MGQDSATLMRKIILLTALLAVACSKHGDTTPAAEPIDTIPLMVLKVRQCSRLYTTEYRIRKIITHNDKAKVSGKLLQKDFSLDLPLGERRIAIPVSATLKAYIDFDGFSEANIRREGSKLSITLPDPRIALTATKIDHDGVKQYVALTRRNFTDEELTAYERQGRSQILTALPRTGIMEQARRSAARQLLPIFTAMGYREEDITISFRKQFTGADLSSLLDATTTERKGASHD